MLQIVSPRLKEFVLRIVALVEYIGTWPSSQKRTERSSALRPEQHSTFSFITSVLIESREGTLV